MNKLIFFSILLLLFNNCSLNKNVKIWKGKENTSDINKNVTKAFVKENKNISLHYVGSIQSRKTKSILNYCDVIHSIDRMKIVKLIKDYEKNNWSPECVDKCFQFFRLLQLQRGQK